MAELHSITGLFYESFPGISPWGGYFIRGADEDEDEIEGMLSDLHGISRINGTMDPYLLEFRKQYQKNNGLAFEYKFNLEDGIWQGEYVGTTPDHIGRSFCKTNLCIKDLTFKKYDLSIPGGYAKALIDSMVESGELEMFKDTETGEDMIKPV